MQGRKLVSVENSEEHFDYAKQYEETFHIIQKEVPEAGEWDIVFIDSFPHENRKEIVRKLANKAKYVVVHDFDGRESYADIFKYFSHYTEVMPETGIFSNVINLEHLKA